MKVNLMRQDLQYLRPLGLYNPKNIDYLKKQVVIAKDLTSDVVKKLEKGAKVLWLPTTSSHFVTADDTLSQ